MRKKIFAVIAFVLTVSLVFTAGASAKIGLELRGGSVMINPTSLNDAYSSVFSWEFGTGYSGDGLTGSGYSNASLDVVGSNLPNFATFGGSLQFFAADNFAIYIKGDYNYLENDDVITVDNVEIIDSHIAFNLMYLGIGGRYYFNPKGFMPYISVDLGYFMVMNAFWELYTPNENDYLNILDPGVVDYKNGFIGVTAELGFQFMFSDSVGVGAGVGYRLASGSTTGATKSGIFDDAAYPLNASAFVADLNFSGLYFSGGLNFIFGSSGKGGATAAAAGGTGAGAKYEQYGDYYFKQKNYAYALKYYAGAMKLDPKNANIYKKIGLTYYYNKDVARAKQYLMYYYKMNPNDAQIKKWLGQ